MCCKIEGILLGLFSLNSNIKKNSSLEVKRLLGSGACKPQGLE